jgi:hypothetical protein
LRGGSGGTCSGGAGLGGLAFLIGECGLQGALTGVLFFLTQTAGIAALRTLRRLSRARRLGLLRTVYIRRGRTDVLGLAAGSRRADAALGFHHHRLGAAMAEALLDGARRNIAAYARLQRERCALAWLVVILIVVAHPAAY